MLRNASSNSSWPIFLTYRTFDAKVDVLMDSSELELEIVLNPKDDWIEFNPNYVGIYKVKYGDELYKRLLIALQKKQLTKLARLLLLSERYSLAVRGDISAVNQLKLLEHFKLEDEYLVWKEIAIELRSLAVFLSPLQKEGALCNYVQALLETIRGRRDLFTFDRRMPKAVKKTNVYVLRALGSCGDKKVVDKAREIFEDFIANGTKIDDELKGVVFEICVYNAQTAAKTLSTLFAAYVDTPEDDARDVLVSAMCVAQGEANIGKVIDFAWRSMKQQDVLSTLTSLSTTLVGRRLLWRFVRDKMADFEKRWKSDPQFAIFAGELTRSFVGDDVRDDVRDMVDFWRQKSDLFPGIGKQMAQAEELLLVHGDWLRRDASKVVEYLQTIKPPKGKEEV